MVISLILSKCLWATLNYHECFCSTNTMNEHLEHSWENPTKHEFKNIGEITLHLFLSSYFVADAITASTLTLFLSTYLMTALMTASIWIYISNYLFQSNSVVASAMTPTMLQLWFKHLQFFLSCYFVAAAVTASTFNWYILSRLPLWHPPL